MEKAGICSLQVARHSIILEDALQNAPFVLGGRRWLIGKLTPTEMLSCLHAGDPNLLIE